MTEVCEWFKFYDDIKTNEIVFEFSDGTVKRAKRGAFLDDCIDGVSYQTGYARGLEEGRKYDRQHQGTN